MYSELSIQADEIFADIRSAAWLEQELHGDLNRHRRHQMADICEEANAERVWRVLGVAVAELRLALQRILSQDTEIGTANELDRPDSWKFHFQFPLPAAAVGFLREKIHEFLVAAVMADRAAVIIPECAAIWRDRAADTLAALRTLAATARPPHTPVRRPLWPM